MKRAAQDDTYGSGPGAHAVRRRFAWRHSVLLWSLVGSVIGAGVYLEFQSMPRSPKLLEVRGSEALFLPEYTYWNRKYGFVFLVWAQPGTYKFVTLDPSGRARTLGYLPSRVGKDLESRSEGSIRASWDGRYVLISTERRCYVVETPASPLRPAELKEARWLPHAAVCWLPNADYWLSAVDEGHGIQVAVHDPNTGHLVASCVVTVPGMETPPYTPLLGVTRHGELLLADFIAGRHTPFGRLKLVSVPLCGNSGATRLRIVTPPAALREDEALMLPEISPSGRLLVWTYEQRQSLPWFLEWVRTVIGLSPRRKTWTCSIVVTGIDGKKPVTVITSSAEAGQFTYGLPDDAMWLPGDRIALWWHKKLWVTGPWNGRGWDAAK